MTPENWVTLAVALVVASPGLLAWLRQRRKEKADTADVLTTAAGKIVISLQSTADRSEIRMAALETEIAKAEERIGKLEGDNRDLRATLRMCIIGIKKLHAQLVEHQIVPAWEPIEVVIPDG